MLKFQPGGNLRPNEGAPAARPHDDAEIVRGAVDGAVATQRADYGGRRQQEGMRSVHSL